MDTHGNYDIKIDNFANTATAASASTLRIQIPKLGSAASKKAHGRIGIKVGNPANTSGTAPLVRSRPLWST
jgi:hypothetical protein